MGGGASSQAAFEQMLACTMILGDAMVQGLDPRFVRFPDLYRLYDFHVGPKKQQPRGFQGGNMVLFVHSPDENGKFQQIILDDGSSATKIADATDKESMDIPSESNDDFLVVYVGEDKILLDKATLNQPNNDGWTPLHAACHVLNAQEAGITILKELVARKENLNLVTRRGPGSFSCGWTPLHIACAYGLEALSLKLIRANANVNTKNSIGWTPLYDACHRGYISVVRELLKAGARHDIICPEFALCPFPGQYPLAEASRQGHTETVKALLEWGVDKNAANKLGWTALHEAAYHGRVAIVQMLIVYGADILIRTEKGSLAKDLTIHSEIRSMLEDIAQHTSTSPKKEKPSLDTDGGEKSPTKSSPTKDARHNTLLSRKEDYALLGDLPNLATKSIPSISIQDVEGDDDDNGKTNDADQIEVDAKQHESSPSKSKRKKRHKHKSKVHGKEIPDQFKCAISRKLLEDPLRSPFGHVYERVVIEAWFRDFGNRCPLTGEPLTFQQLTSDDKLKAEIRTWMHGPQKTIDESGNDTMTSNTTDSAEAKATETAPAEDDPYDF